MNNIADRIQQDPLLNLTRTLVKIPSITGQEQTIADWLFDYLESLELDQYNGCQLKTPEKRSLAGWKDRKKALR